MKHLIILCLALFFIAGTQNTQAQTKEETIAWIKEKLESSTEGAYGPQSNLKVKTITECTITYTYTKEGGEYEETIPVKNATINNDEYKAFKYPGEMVLNKNLTKGTQRFYNISDLRIVEREANLRERFLKALNHLATFCVEKKQTF